MSDDEKDAASGPAERSAWLTVLIFMLFYALGYLDKRLITLLIDPIRATLGISDLQMSLLSGLAFVGFYVIFSFPVGWAVDRMSRRLITFWGVIAWSGFAALGGFARSFPVLLLSRFGVGAGEAVLMPASHSIFADLFPREKLTRALGIFTLGAFIGSAASFAIGGSLLAHFEGRASIILPLAGPVAPWQAVMIFTGAPGLLLAFLVFLVREPARRVSHAGPATGEASVFGYMKRHLRFFTLHFIGFSGLAIMTAGFSSWLPTHILRSYGEPISHVGITLAVLQLTIGPLGMLLIARAVDRGFRADAHLSYYVLGALALTSVGMLVGFAPDVRIAYVGVALFDALQGGFLPVAGAALQLTTPAHCRGRVTAFFFVFYNIIGQALGPIVVALFTDLVFASDQRIGASIAMTCLIAGPLSAMLLYFGRAPMRRALAEAEA